MSHKELTAHGRGATGISDDAALELCHSIRALDITDLIATAVPVPQEVIDRIKGLIHGIIVNPDAPIEGDVWS